MTPQKEAALSDSWKRTLEAIPSMLGRLSYLASLRNSNTGTYEHFGLSERVGELHTDRLLRRSHLEVFQQWLCFGLQRQKQELEEYLSGVDGDKRGIIAHWLCLEPYAVWIPGESRDVERKLFYSDLSVVLELIRADYGVASRDRDS
jgi:hypothetical protein